METPYGLKEVAKSKKLLYCFRQNLEDKVVWD